MNIKLKNIPKFQNGGVPQWFLNIYGNRTKLLNWDLNQGYNFSNENLNTNDHRNAGNLNMAYQKNLAYTGTPGAITSDIQSFYDSDGNGMSAEEFEKFYNLNAEKIRNHWNQDQTYNASTAGDHNRLFRKMFQSRSNTSMSPGSTYNIGYQDNLENIEGSSTWLRRMDRYENEFDPNNIDSNRLHQIQLKDGTLVTYYKKSNGDIGLLKNNNLNTNQPQNTESTFGIVGKHTEYKKPFDLNVLKNFLNRNANNLLGAGRLAYSLNTNKRMLNEQLKGVRPQLQGSYHTYHQVFGDEATKQAYYRRAAQGQTQADKPFTSDADRQMAYKMEAKRIGDDLKSQGDLADNQEIRRTSELAKQHADANTARDNQVANSNYLALIQANAQKQNLKSNRLAADYSSINNYLLEKQTRLQQREAQNKLIEDQLYALDENYKLKNDTSYRKLYDDMNKAYNEAVAKYTNANGDIDYAAVQSDPTFKNAQLAYQNKQYQIQRQRLIDSYNRRNTITYSKRGSKLTYKQKDDLLYKTARDVADHYRKMVKLTDNSTLRSFKRPIKLIKPPKLQTGGVAPFSVYTPAPMGGEMSQEQYYQQQSANSEKNKQESSLDVIKELFKNVEGLPSDVELVYKSMTNFLNKAEIFGEEIKSDDLATMYLQQLRQLNNIKFSKERYDQAEKQAIDNDALNEFAVTDDGKFVVQDSETGNISTKSWEEIKEAEGKFNPLTNNHLLNIRAYDKSGRFTLGSGDSSLLTIVNKGIGLSKIAEFLNKQASDIGSNKETIEGYSKVQSNQISQGFEQLLQGAPDGDYKFTKKTESQKQQIDMALKYISSILPNNMKAVLKAHADIQGTTPDTYIAMLLGSRMKNVSELTFDAVSGKASKDSNGNSKGSSEDIKSNPIMQMIQQRGGVPRTWEIVTKDSNVKMSVDGSYYSQIPKVTDDMSIDAMLTTSGFSGVLDSKQGITFGDQNINPEQLKDIMYSNTGGMIVTLPCKIVNGHKEVNLGIKKSYEEALEEVDSRGISRQSPEFNKTLGQVLKQKGLDSLLDSKGYPDKTKFAEFLVVEAYATSKVKGLDTKSQYIEKVADPDSQLEQRLTRALSTNDKKDNYSLDIDYWLYGDDVYRGTMFIPLTNNLNASINAWGDQIKVDESEDLENKFQNFNKASTMKPSNSNVLYETK